MTADRIAPPVAALFPESRVRETIDDRLTRALAAATQRVLRGPVMPDSDMTELRHDLAAFAIEQHVIRALAQRAGLPADSGGHFTTSGSEANYTALICALTRADTRFADDGVRAFDGPVA